ncbi:MAG: Spy/CpxP family protein refolding chaperone [Bacteroidales bacterium]
MKSYANYSRLLFLIILTLSLTGSEIMAQRQGRGNQGRKPGQNYNDSLRGQGRGPCQNIPDVSQDQEIKIEKSRIEMLKNITPLENQIDEKEARLKSMNAEDNIDQAGIDKTIDEIADLNAKVAKLQNKHIQEIRSFLTEDQKVYFDSNPRPNFGKNKGDGNGPRHKKSKMKRQAVRGPACR